MKTKKQIEAEIIYIKDIIKEKEDLLKMDDPKLLPFPSGYNGVLRQIEKRKEAIRLLEWVLNP